MEAKGGASHSGRNMVDPMKLTVVYRDKFPKTNLRGGFLGDGYPLCNELPPRQFLSKGARYKFTGTASVEGSYFDAWAHLRGRFAPNATTSPLYAVLCSRDSGTGRCSFPSEVVLDTTLECDGDVECGAPVSVADVPPRTMAEQQPRHVGLARLRFAKEGGR